MEIERKAFKSPWPKELFEYELSSPHSFSFSAKHNDKLLGYIISKIVSDRLHITNLAIKEEYRRKGIASLLLSFVMDKISQKGLKGVFLEVRTSNTSAINLYQKFGFKIFRISKKYYMDGEDAYIMVKNEIGKIGV